MDTPTHRNPASTANVGVHPIHPMLIPFPIAFLVATFFCDLGYWWSGVSLWWLANLWVLGAAVIMALLAAAAGLTDFLGDKRVRDLSDAWHHMIGNVTAVLIAAVNTWYRYSAGEPAILPWGLVMSTVVVLILLYTGWRGWEMVYRHRVAVLDRES